MAMAKAIQCDKNVWQKAIRRGMWIQENTNSSYAINNTYVSKWHFSHLHTKATRQHHTHCNHQPAKGSPGRIAKSGVFGQRRSIKFLSSSVLNLRVTRYPSQHDCNYQLYRSVSSSVALAAASTDIIENNSDGLWSNFFASVANSPPTLLVGDGFCWVHDMTGLDWYATIFVSTFILRFFLMGSAHVTSQKVAAKRRILYQNMERDFIPVLKQEMAKLVKRDNLGEEYVRKKWTSAINVVTYHNVVKYNCGSSKLFLPFLLQIPLWVCSSMALRNLSTLQHVSENSHGGTKMEMEQLIEAKFRFLQLSTEGFGWITNLTLPDQTWIVPCVVGLSFLAVNEINHNRYKRDFVNQGSTDQSLAPKKAALLKEDVSEEKVKKEMKLPINNKKESVSSTSFEPFLARLQRYSHRGIKPDYVSNLFRFLSILMIPAAAMSPSAVAWYWMASGLSGLAVNLTLLSPKFRNFVKIPRLPENSNTPYRDVIDNVKAKLRRTISRYKIL